MNLRKLPPAMVLTLGLSSCTQSSTCLSYDPTSADTEANPSTGTAGTMGTGSSGEFDVGPCLGQVEPETSTTSTGGSDSGTSSDGTADGGSGSGSGSDSGSGTAGALDEPASPEQTRARVLQRVLSRGILPADVVASLRSRDEEG